MTVLKSGDTVQCPKCHTTDIEGVVDDYVIPGYVGEKSRALETCYECEAEFSVMRRPDGMFVVELED
jgi:hypothetical protein